MDKRGLRWTAEQRFATRSRVQDRRPRASSNRRRSSRLLISTRQAFPASAPRNRWPSLERPICFPCGHLPYRATVAELTVKLFNTDEGLGAPTSEFGRTATTSPILTATVAKDGAGGRAQVARRQGDGTWLRLLDLPEFVSAAK